MNTKTAKTRILAGEFDTALSRLYGDARVPAQRIRYANAVASFEQLYGDRDVAFFSVPGRTEIIGNHTDHNNGRVIAASVDIDIIAAAWIMSMFMHGRIFDLAFVCLVFIVFQNQICIQLFQFHQSSYPMTLRTSFSLSRK